jgi:Rrf2 family protein
VHVSAKVDYAIRALVTLAAAGGGPKKADELAEAQNLPVKFLENILNELRRAALITSQRGAEGGYRLARPADTITLAQIIRPLDGPLAAVRGLRPETTAYDGPAVHLREVWVAVRASMRAVLEEVTLADVATGNLPPSVTRFTEDADAWAPH